MAFPPNWANGIGQTASSLTTDTPSANGTASYPDQMVGAGDVTFSTIFTGGAPFMCLNPLMKPTDVFGVPVATPPGATPVWLPRTPPVVGQVNSSERGVYFGKKEKGIAVLVPVIGDGITGTGADPTVRTLTYPGKYTKIFIGTRT